MGKMGKGGNGNGANKKWLGENGKGNGITWKWNKMEMGEIEMREHGNRESGKWEMGGNGNRGKWK